LRPNGGNLPNLVDNPILGDYLESPVTTANRIRGIHVFRPWNVDAREQKKNLIEFGEVLGLGSSNTATGKVDHLIDLHVGAKIGSNNQ